MKMYSLVCCLLILCVWEETSALPTRDTAELATLLLGRNRARDPPDMFIQLTDAFWKNFTIFSEDVIPLVFIQIKQNNSLHKEGIAVVEKDNGFKVKEYFYKDGGKNYRTNHEEVKKEEVEYIKTCDKTFIKASTHVYHFRWTVCTFGGENPPVFIGTLTRKGMYFSNENRTAFMEKETRGILPKHLDPWTSKDD
ncbi:hypothetical protein BgiBS90_020149 [Biomphalaria glabrata]|nr:hypothetical protein BgiBS90_020149 [Biomphalaria glabrata]